jgi:aldose sugar dehydrogenase
MKNGIYVLAAASLTMFCAREGMAQSHFGGPGNVAELWNNMCASCHGVNGEGGPAGTPSLLMDELFEQENGSSVDQRFFDKIKNGVPNSGMNAFKDSLDDAKMWSLVVHLRELQHKAWREGNDPTPKEKLSDASHVYSTQRRSFRIEAVAGHDKATKLSTPWAIAFVPMDAKVESLRGAMIVNEKGGQMHVLHADGTLSGAVAGIPKVSDQGQGGLMDVELHPDFATNGWVYIAFSDFVERRNEKGEKWREVATKVVRGELKLRDESSREYVWTNEETIFQTRPENYITNAKYHFGCRIAFDPAINGARGGFVFISIGDHGAMDHAQQLTRHNGKVHRLRDDGSIPDDNPFVNRASEDSSVLKSIWSYGHRNPQGLAFDGSGKLWNTEHGMRGGDELNQVQFGNNYGWPVVSYSINYADTTFKTPWAELDPKLSDTKIAMPALRWSPSIAACGLAGGAALAGDVLQDDEWNATDLFAGGLAMNTVRRVRVVDGLVTEEEEVVYGLGRVRDVVWGPAKRDKEGKGLPRDLYVVLNGPDRVVRLVAVGGE